MRARRLRRRRLFDAIARELACNYRVIAYDRRGCGESGDAADGRYDLAAQAADLQAVIEHIGAPANVLAHSAGTLVALELLRANPAIISRAILHEPAVTNEVPAWRGPVLLEMIAAGKVSRALRAFLGAIGDSDPEAPKLTEAEAKPCPAQRSQFHGERIRDYYDLRSRLG